ncbi:MAG: tRNA (adenosine(37)-N6)-dimethylallyltransferase MiaA [Armatimonadota bacterium]
MPYQIAVLTGPTAVGKTEIALHVAKALNAEIVSADSMAVYRGLEVATAKPTPDERARVPHYLIDVADPRCLFTVADYRRLALQAIAQIADRGKLPLVVGGTRLYIVALTSGFFEGPGADPDFRRQMQDIALREGTEVLHRRLAQLDPDTAARLAPRDLKRIIRALEVFELTSVPISRLQAESQRAEPPCRGPMVALIRDRSELYRRIDARADEMIAAGLEREVRSLLEAGLDENLTALQGHGYKEMIGYLKGRYDREEAVRLLKRNTRRYAKRQLSWLRQEKGVEFVDASGPAEEVAERVVSVLKTRLSLGGLGTQTHPAPALED